MRVDMETALRVGVLTAGGDCPGLNAALRAIVKRAEEGHGHTVVGFRRGWRGVAEGDLLDLTREHVRNVLPLGGTLLGTSRYHPGDEDGGIDKVLHTLSAERIGALICIGGDGAITAAKEVADRGVSMVCVPKTIDNDVEGTDRSIGFDTAVGIATEAIDRVHTTAESHDRVMVVEVMGHHAGWIAIAAGTAGGADWILIPEEPFCLDEMCAAIQHRHRAHASYSIVVAAEGASPRDASRQAHPQTSPVDTIVAGVLGEGIAAAISERTGFETRLTVLGHIQRGGPPTATDRLLASRFGVAAADAVSTADTAMMTALTGDEVTLVPLSSVAGRRKIVPEPLRRTGFALT